jgi:hypothetical protein
MDLLGFRKVMAQNWYDTLWFDDGDVDNDDNLTFQSIPITTEPAFFEREVAEHLFDTNRGKFINHVETKIAADLNREVNQLLIGHLKNLTRNVETIDIEVKDFSESSIICLYTKYFYSSKDTLQVWCSDTTFKILRDHLQNTRLSLDFIPKWAVSGVAIGVCQIPENEIWLIEPQEWAVVLSDIKENVTQWHNRRYRYTSTFKISKPFSKKSKLVKIRLAVKTVEQREVDAMQELMRRMLIPNTPVAEANTVTTGSKSVWLDVNPEWSLKAVKDRVSKVVKELPQMFNPWESKKKDGK